MTKEEITADYVMHFGLEDMGEACLGSGDKATIEWGVELVKTLNIHNVMHTLIAWEQYKEANWYESEDIDVEKMLMEQFKVIYCA